MTEQVNHEHQTIKTELDAASAACAAWRQRPSAETGEALAAALDRLNAVVQPHLDDEEQKIVPLAAVTLPPSRNGTPSASTGSPRSPATSGPSPSG